MDDRVIPDKLKNFELEVEVTEAAIVKGDCGTESCPIALSVIDELPTGWKISVGRETISIYDEEMHETQFVNEEWVSNWIFRFDDTFSSLPVLNHQVVDNYFYLLEEAAPFKISLTKNKDGERWAKEVM